jgi:type II restriction/modification system DNA methylase subunit YeeA
MKLNHLFIEAYVVEEEVDGIVPIEEITLDLNPYYRYGSDKSESELEVLLLADTMREFISYAVGCMTGRYSLDKPGLILARQGETIQDYLRIVGRERWSMSSEGDRGVRSTADCHPLTFEPNEDNVIPMLDGDWFTDDINERFKEFLRVTFGTEHYEENLTFLENALYPDNSTGKERRTIREYFLNEFHNHHNKLYKKCPVYWLVSSGKHGAFRALIYMHRYNSSTLSRMLTEYVIPLQFKFNARIEKVESEIPAAGSKSLRKKLESELKKLIKQRGELEEFDEKLRHYADQRIELDLDDGVKVNYAKFGDLLVESKAMIGGKDDE